MRAAVLTLLFASASPAFADYLRCGNRLVSVGDSAYEATSKCGAPTAQDRRTEERDGSYVTVDTWVYDLGPHDFIRILTLVDGRLRKIDLGDYGR